MTTLRPLRVGDNRVPVYYAGGRRISAFRGASEVDGPEDWVGSVSALPAAILPAGAPAGTGISATEDGPLRQLIAADPAGWLGPGPAFPEGETGLLVKLLDAGERLPVHCHPTRAFARARLGSFFGKTEGWIVLDAEPDAKVWLGLRETATAGLWRDLVDAQDTHGMLALMNELPVRAGQVLYVPAGLPHAIGPGVFITELQEPTSFSILADHDAFGVGADAATLGLGWDLALSCFDLGGYGDRLDALLPAPTVLRRSGSDRLSSLFAPAADEFFRAWLVECAGTVALPGTGFAVVVVTGGTGQLEHGDASLPISAGQTWVVPAAAGHLRFSGVLTAIVCLPPER
ncbi:hypothetical protein [Dactylosporangium sp. NPDC050588]|uniref:class I mannose-6-phosphate isomerase n=1 Tax=Dactylosporangium sp. NPDC050588 TaxID=3157211 RepID=UPI0033FAE4B7